MSENKLSFTLAGLEITTTEQSNLVIPNWLAEALLVGQYWNQSGLLEQLQQQVRVSRGRMGRYEVCDFVLLLLAYAVSGVETLKLFFEQLESIKPVLMSVWKRARCPVAATLSRFLAAVDEPAVELFGLNSPIAHLILGCLPNLSLSSLTASATAHLLILYALTLHLPSSSLSHPVLSFTTA
jgi:hypothetical protein